MIFAAAVIPREDRVKVSLSALFKKRASLDFFYEVFQQDVSDKNPAKK